MSRIADLVTQVQDHWHHELSKAVKVIAETGRERNALQAELDQAHATLTAAMEGRQWQLERAVQAETEAARLGRWLVQIHAALAERGETETEAWAVQALERAMRGEAAG